MTTINTYKRLFEVRLLHEFYLLSTSDPTFFDLPDLNRFEILRRRISSNQYRLNKDLVVAPEPKTSALFEALNWHFLPTSTGFSIAIRTKTITINGNQVEVPFSSLPITMPPLYFHLRVQKGSFNNYTAIPLSRNSLPLTYYFTNHPDAVHDSDFSTLSLPVSTFIAGENYDMGEIAEIGGQIQEAPNNTNTDVNWLPVQGKGWVNRNDRICLAKRFRYRFPDSNSEISAVFTLKSPDNTVLKTVSISSTKPLSIVSLDFSFRKDTNNNNIDILDGLYQLEIQAGSGVQTQNLFLSDAYVMQSFGLIHINMNETDPNYRILNADTSIRNINTDPLGARMHPVFELRLRSRKTYWRYIPTFNGNTFQIIPALANYLQQDGAGVITKRPQIYTFLPYGVLSSNDLDPPETKLPTPKLPAFKPQTPDGLVSEIRTLPINGKIF